MNVFVLNCRSSSVKFGLFETRRMEYLIGGHLDGIGSRKASLTYRVPIRKEKKMSLFIRDHEQAIGLILKVICDRVNGILDSIYEIDAVGHRVFHGGEAFTESVLITEAVFQKIKECVRLAPKRNLPNIAGIRASLRLIPFARQIAVFDTAFHQSMEAHAYIYGLPYEWYKDRGIRRYGFHGISHRYVALRTAQLLGRPIEALKLIICHLGNESSVTAVDGGRSTETSMGFTPLEGLVMGTRCGDLDPAILLYLMEEERLTPAEMDSILNRKSGLWGLTGGDVDPRIIEEKAEAGSENHRLALRIFAHRVKKYIGGYAAVLGGLDSVIFTADIGENSPMVRRMSCEGMEFLGIEIDHVENENTETCISRGRTQVLVVPTNEEIAIAQDVVTVLTREEQLIEAEKSITC